MSTGWNYFPSQKLSTVACLREYHWSLPPHGASCWTVLANRPSVTSLAGPWHFYYETSNSFVHFSTDTLPVKLMGFFYFLFFFCFWCTHFYIPVPAFCNSPISGSVLGWSEPLWASVSLKALTTFCELNVKQRQYLLLSKIAAISQRNRENALSSYILYL